MLYDNFLKPKVMSHTHFLRQTFQKVKRIQLIL